MIETIVVVVLISIIILSIIFVCIYYLTTALNRLNENKEKLIDETDLYSIYE